MLLQFNRQELNAVIELPGSKSISNRLLILQDLLNTEIEIHNLSPSTDTRDLFQALKQIRENNSSVINVGAAGTDMRFLTALLCTKKGEWLLTGSERMKERPIKVLVDALQKLGARITYAGREGFPPLKITGTKLHGAKIEMDGSVSSQFISALLLIAPALENGLEIILKNKPVSWPYIQMTIDILKELDIHVSAEKNQIEVSPAPLKNKYTFNVEADWSAASYWYSMAAICAKSEIELRGLKKNSLQGDSVLPEIYSSFGVSTIFKQEGIVIKKDKIAVSDFEYDFTNCPDIAQTLAVTSLALKINCRLTGLSTLRHKETDRISALKNELEKFGASVKITPDSLELETRNYKPETRNIQTYHDHRMAMSFAPLALISPIDIENPLVVEKSYPAFWDHLRRAGFTTSM